MAKDRGLKINEYGVFRKSIGKAKNRKRPEDDRNDEGIYIAGRTEEDVYATLDLPWIPPELREDRWEFDWAAEGKLPKLIEAGRHARRSAHAHRPRPTARRRSRK